VELYKYASEELLGLSRPLASKPPHRGFPSLAAEDNRKRSRFILRMGQRGNYLSGMAKGFNY